jgi:hypothetical protein
MEDERAEKSKKRLLRSVVCLTEAIETATQKSNCSMNEEQTITIPLRDFVDILIGDADNCPIPQQYAELVFLLTKNEHTCFIEWADEMSPNLQVPLMWRIPAWRQRTESWLRAKNYSDKERVKRWIFEGNVQRITKELMKISGLEEHLARIAAFSMLKNNKTGNIKMVGVQKLIEKESEL